jgi:guanylate kinase
VSNFLLLLGPSGVGKSTIINQLKELDDRFVYISPYTTRQLRKGEKDKVSISDEIMDKKDKAGEFLVINNLYGIRYATPRLPIVKALGKQNFPVLDWPIDKIDIMLQAFPNKITTVYVSPPNLDELKHRIEKDGRDSDGSRFESAKKELQRYWSGEFDQFCNFKVVNYTDANTETGLKIYASYLKSIGEGNQPSKEQKA